MNTALAPLPECLQAQTGTPVLPVDTLRILIGFDDQPAFQRAMRLCVRVFSEFDGGLDVRPVPWNFNYLTLPEWRALAATHAAAAGLRSVGPLPGGAFPAGVGAPG